jgi:hypothetical protein
MRETPTRLNRHARTLVALVVFMMFAFAPSLSAQPNATAASHDTMVIDWNRHAYEAFGNAPTASTPGIGMPPQVASVHLAIVQAAVYDAVNAIEGGYQPYLGGLDADESASTIAAAATAAHRVLTGIVTVPALTPAIIDRLSTLYDESIAAATSADGPDAVAAGIAAGEAAAAAMLADRADDGRWVPTTWPSGTEPGQWRPTPPGFVIDPNAWMTEIDPFMLDSASQFRTKGPRPLNSVLYAIEYYEVKLLGAATNSWRNAEQEAVAQFFSVNPVEMYNRAFREVAEERGLSTSEQARLFAMTSMAGADALINCFDDKEFWSFWRPVTAIHEGNNDGNRLTMGDPAWTPLLVAPPYSDHSSSYNCYTGGFMHAAEVFFGKGRADFSLVRIVPGQADVTREYRHFRDVIDDTIDARVYQGLHFRTADVQGAGIGRDVARWLEKHFFQPVD